VKIISFLLATPKALEPTDGLKVSDPEDGKSKTALRRRLSNSHTRLSATAGFGRCDLPNEKSRPNPERLSEFPIRGGLVLRVVFDDEVWFHHDWVRHVAKARCANEGTSHFRVVNVHVFRNVALW